MDDSFAQNLSVIDSNRWIYMLIYKIDVIREESNLYRVWNARIIT